MKALFRCASIAIVSLFFAGCIVQSIHPFYTEDLLVQRPELEGAWEVKLLMGDPPDVEEPLVWKFDGQQLHVVDEEGEPAWFDFKLFSVKGILLMDLYPDESKANAFFLMHVAPMHGLYKVQLREGVLTLDPLNYDWVEELVESGAVDLPNARAHDDSRIFLAHSEQWVRFLGDYAENASLFADEDTRFRLVKNR